MATTNKPLTDPDPEHTYEAIGYMKINATHVGTLLEASGLDGWTMEGARWHTLPEPWNGISDITWIEQKEGEKREAYFKRAVEEAKKRETKQKTILC